MSQPLAGVVVAIMYTGGNVLEDYARGKAERDLRSLRDRTPRTAHKRIGEDLTDIAVEDVATGDELLVRAGELIPVDGHLLDPGASIDESAVTGEPLPVTRHHGDLLRSGTVNAGEAFRFRASAVADQSTYAGIVRMVEAAQTAKAPFIRIADRFALFLLPATLIVSGVAWWLSGDKIRALAVLVVATPCPLILAAPVAFIGGVSRAARAGILMKGSAAIEGLAQIRTAIFDKTGTLTEGGARLATMETVPDMAPNEALRLLASLEQASHHVLAGTLVDLARRKGLALSHPTEVREFRGSGIEGKVDGMRIRAGSRTLILDDAALPDWAKAAAASANDRSALAIYLSIDDRLSAFALMADAIREDAPAALARLRASGISRVIMVTGDDSEAANAVAASLKLDDAFSDKSPAEKVAAVEAERARQPTMMIGDGINDAPALAAANVGIAMGARGARLVGSRRCRHSRGPARPRGRSLLHLPAHPHHRSAKYRRGARSFRCRDGGGGVRLHHAGGRRASPGRDRHCRDPQRPARPERQLSCETSLRRAVTAGRSDSREPARISNETVYFSSLKNADIGNAKLLTASEPRRTLLHKGGSSLTQILGDEGTSLLRGFVVERRCQ